MDFSLGEFAVGAQDDGAALSGVKAGEIPEITDDDGTHVRVVCGNFWARAVRWMDCRGPDLLDVSVAPGRRKSLPVETTRHAFAYVFAGAGKFCNASGPLEVLPKESAGPTRATGGGR